MYTGTLDPVSNRAGWTFLRELVDDDTGEPIDLSACSIVLEVRDRENCRVVVSATTDNGKISIVGLGAFQASFTAQEMRSVCAETYNVGCTIKNGDAEPVQFIIGTLPVLDGVVS